MRSAIRVMLVILGCHGGAPAQQVEWIWIAGEAGEGQRVWFHRSFELPQAAVAARLSVTCDNSFSLWLNGQAAARGDDWTRPVWQELAAERRPVAGWNTIAVEGANAGGPAGLALRLELELGSGERIQITSGESWLASRTEPPPGWREEQPPGGEWEGATSLGDVRVPRGPWPDPFTPRVATPPDRIEAPPGFTVELLRSAQPWEGSWVAMTLDERGRVILSPQGGQVMRSVQPLCGLGSPGAGEELEFEPIAIRVGSAQGLLCAHGSLYVNVVAQQDAGGGLHRLRDTDGDDRYDEDTVLRAHGHPSEHGTHAVTLGPDGMLYVVVGNHVPPPEGLAQTSPVRRWGEDLLLPRLWDPRGHAVGVMAPGGQILRTDAAGSSWELVAAGLRNPYDLAFDSEGEMFTYDADMEWDLGAPWYRAPRVLHVTSGADFGWRSGTGKWPATYPDTLPSVVDTDLASPTGLCFATGSSFPAPWRGSLLACDWAYGRILSVRLHPEGASYSGDTVVFAQGTPLAVTDLVFGDDGALYFITGGRGTQAGLYRVTGPGADADPDLGGEGVRLDLDQGPDLIEIASDERDGRAALARRLRRRLEALHGKHDAAGLEIAWPHLQDLDRHVRYAARIAVESRPVDTWRERALAASATGSRLEALLALARAGENRDRQLILAKLAGLPWAELAPDQRLPSLRVAALCYARGVTGADALVEPMLEWLAPAYPSGIAELDRELLEILVYLDAPMVVHTALEQLESAEQSPALSIALALRLARSGWDESSRRRYLEWLRGARTLTGGLSLPGFVAAMEKEWLGGLDETARHELLGDGEPAEPAPAAEAPARPFVQAWTMADIAPHLEEVDRGRDFERGRATFTAALCVQCHPIAGAGGTVGPDLTGVGSRYGRRELLEQVLEPSKVVSDQYQQVLVTRTDGSMIAGRVVEDALDHVTLDTNPFGGAPVEIPRADIASTIPSPISLMPVGLLYTLTLDEILDLLAYLETGGER